MVSDRRRKKISIAVDGPAGSGKSTVARRIAVELGLLYIDTGAMYRGITLKALRQGISLHNEAALARLAKETSLEFREMPDGSHHLFMDGEDVSEEIRSMPVNDGVSLVAAVKEVRAALVEKQQNLGARGGVVMDGRDIGTVVLPQAEWKFFLTASPQERARRRWRELKAKGLDVSLAEIEANIANRDEIDSTRKVNPLRPAADALFLDTTEMSIEEVVDWIKKKVGEDKTNVL
ncbi:MAG: (d)CMP kinase [Firmicutes bacterium]|nr:(d)CMP kinase [Bacillota bacterium]